MKTLSTCYMVGLYRLFTGWFWFLTVHNKSSNTECLKQAINYPLTVMGLLSWAVLTKGFLMWLQSDSSWSWRHLRAQGWNPGRLALSPTIPCPLPSLHRVSHLPWDSPHGLVVWQHGGLRRVAFCYMVTDFQEEKKIGKNIWANPDWYGLVGWA